MSKRDYHDWYYYLEEDDHLVARVLIGRKGSPTIGGGYIDRNKRGWRIWYVEDGPRVHNARLEPAPELDGK